jgi:signal transduction histidine kinase
MSWAGWFAFVAPLVVLLFTMGVNFSVWKNGRDEFAHRSLALSCLAGMVLLLADGLLYASDSRAEASLARCAIYLAMIPLQLAGVRLYERKHRTKLGARYRIAAGLGGLWAIGSLLPGLLHGEGVVWRDTGPLGIAYVDVTLTAAGALAPLALIASPLVMLWRMASVARRGPDRAAVVVVGLGSNLAVVIDLLVLGGWIDAPFVFAIQFTASMVVYTVQGLRRFVAALERVEASADLLQRAAEGRAAELRQIDLRLAHGARLAALGTLAASLAHEINNPAAFIRSNLNYLVEHADDRPGDAELEEVVQETEEGVARLRVVVGELLRMSSHQEAHFADVRLTDVVESALPALRFEAGAAVVIRARLTAVPAVRADRNLLGQVVTNLGINAIQAVRSAGEGGEVCIATFAEDERVVLEVSDTGAGVAPDLAPRIFEPFFTTKPAGQGTGLGLAVTRQLVERHGGRLALLPSENGARFRVELPIAPAQNGLRERRPNARGAA